MAKKTLLYVALACAFCAGIVSYVSAQEVISTSAYRQYKDVGPFDIPVPTVVQVPLEGGVYERSDLAVYDNETKTFQPYLIKTESTIETVGISVDSDVSIGDPKKLNDGDTETSVEYSLPDDRRGTTKVTLTAEEPITSSSLSVLLDERVALPTSIEIRTKDDGKDTIVFAKSPMNGQTVGFLETTARVWEIVFEYGQPLRIVEMRLSQDDAERSNERSVRFLAQPEHTYRIYLNPDRYMRIPTGESSDLVSDVDVLNVTVVPTSDNSAYKEADVDEDGVSDVRDNCVSVKNPDQTDVNDNGRGDACDDFDKDGRMNSVDNCPDQPNASQEDTDGDDIGDVCDSEESRLTEKYAWLPWAGMGLAAIVIVGLFATTVKGMKKKGVEARQREVVSAEPPQNGDFQ